MELAMTKDGTALTVAIQGRIDMLTAPDFEVRVNKEIDASQTKALILDFAAVEYLSSLGLRVLLELQKKMVAKEGTMKIRNVNVSIMDIFNITGFTNILTIE